MHKHLSLHCVCSQHSEKVVQRTLHLHHKCLALNSLDFRDILVYFFGYFFLQISPYFVGLTSNARGELHHSISTARGRQRGTISIENRCELIRRRNMLHVYRQFIPH